MTQARLRTGRVGEDVACELLERHGAGIVARNSRTRAGEIDVVALDCGTLVFVEVKTMRTGARSGPERPALAVGPRKQLQVRRLARAWLAENRPPRYDSIRFDVIGVSLDPGDSPVTIERITDAF
ncbi:MAG: YraN family protein [Actinomycetota bacterium]|nr:YraN family protein [Actinomycetota bacterium]